MDKVRFGFFPEFKNPTILFWGSRESLEAMHRVLLSLEQRKHLKLENDSNFVPLARIKLTLSLVEASTGMRVENVDDSTFRWNLSKEDAIQIAEKVLSVILSEEPCHHYLDSFSGDIEVVVSKGEYPDTLAP